MVLVIGRQRHEPVRRPLQRQKAVEIGKAMLGGSWLGPRRADQQQLTRRKSPADPVEGPGSGRKIIIRQRGNRRLRPDDDVRAPDFSGRGAQTNVALDNVGEGLGIPFFGLRHIGLDHAHDRRDRVGRQMIRRLEPRDAPGP